MYTIVSATVVQINHKVLTVIKVLEIVGHFHTAAVKCVKISNVSVVVDLDLTS